MKFLKSINPYASVFQTAYCEGAWRWDKSGNRGSWRQWFYY